MKYKFKNGAVLKMLEKLVIVAIDPLVCYLIVIVSYVKSLLIIKLIFINIEFKVFKEDSYTYDSLVKFG